MSVEHATTSSTIDPAAPATLSHPSPIHTSHAPQKCPPLEPPQASTPSLGSLWSPDTSDHTERIPKLSATTTEILARVNGNIKNTIQGLGTTGYPNPGYNASNTIQASSTEAKTDMMKPPSTTTVTFPTTHLVEPGKQVSTSGSSLKSEASLPATSPNLQINDIKGFEDVVTPKTIQPKTAPLSTAAATPSSNPSTSSIKKRQMNATRRGNGGAKRGQKRRRGNKDDNDDDSDANGNGSSSDEATPSATQTKSGRQIHRPSFLAPPPKEPTASPDEQPAHPTRKRRRVYRKGKEVNITCSHCQRGHSPSSNVIVFCDECNGAWHQFCHDPPIGNDVIQVKEAEWFCRECKPVSNTMDNSAAPISAYPDVKPAEKIDKLVGIPFSAKVGGEQYSTAEKHAHLSRLSHTALVNLLMDISNSDPSLPIFPSNLSQTHDPSYITPTNTTTSTPATSMTTSFTSTAATSAKSANNTPPIVISGSSLNGEAPSTQEDDEFEDIEEHRLYPKPGNGFHLPPESEDLDMLLEDPLCPTFSHSLHGPAKATAEASGMVGVSGMA